MTTNRNPGASYFTANIHHDTYKFIKSLRGEFGDRRVLITGASKGIGQEIAISFARAGYGHIALLARSSVASTVAKVNEAAQSARHKVPQILELSADITSAESIDAAADKVQSTWGSLDVLINNAGYLETWRRIIESNPDDWWRSWEVNVKGTYLMDRAFIPLLLTGDEKHLITVTSAGAWFTLSGASAYQSSKTAQVRFNNFLMAEYGEQVRWYASISDQFRLTLRQGLCAYTVHPGGVKTDLASGMPEHMNSILVDEPALAADTLVWLTQEKRDW